MNPLDTALQELQQKSITDIQRETAFRWAKRAQAASALQLADTVIDEYAHEALEHAGLSGDDMALARVRQILLFQGDVDPSTLQELQQKTLFEIQTDTAITYAWRAYAAIQLWRQQAGSSYHDDAIEYRHEAVEHAVLANNDEVLQTVRKIIPAL